MFLQVCPVCEHRNPRGSRFCNECGSPLQLRFCPACNAAEDVMALECRSCGEKLPPVLLVESPQILVDSAPTGESIWKADAPPPGLNFGGDGVVVTVHGGADATPAVDQVPAQELERVATLAPEAAPESEIPIAGDAPPEPVPHIEPVLVAVEAGPHVEPLLVGAESGPQIGPVSLAAEPVPVTRGPSTIERFHAARAELDPDPLSSTPPPSVSSEPDGESAELNAESESEIEVSAEAETLVEASVAPVTYQPPEEIAIADTAPVDEIAAQLGDGAWRSAMSVDDGNVTRLAPALIQTPPPPKRRLSMHFIGLVIAGLGAVGAVVYSARLAPGTSYVPAQAATPTPITRNTVETLSGAAALSVAVPEKTNARSVETQAEVQAPQPITRATETPANNLPQSTLAPAVAPAKVATRTDTRPPAPATPVRETMTPPVAHASRLPLEAARPCTPAIEALGLCTQEASQEGK